MVLTFIYSSNLLVIQVTNKASNKIFDVEWNLRVGNVEKTSLPARSFKDNPGNTVTMNEVFMLYVSLQPPPALSPSISSCSFHSPQLSLFENKQKKWNAPL